MNGRAVAAGRTVAPFVGRRRELDELRAGWAAAVEGRGEVFLIPGDPGVGKTRLLTALVDAAETECLWATCWDGGGAPGYWPWIQLIRQLGATLSPAELEAALGAGAPYVAQLAPELRDALPTLPEAPSMDFEQARFSVFDATATFFRRVAAERPLLLVIDDLHAADQGSLLLLEFLARTLKDARILVAGTYRESTSDQDPTVADLVARLVQATRSVPLRGLDVGAVTELVESFAGESVPGALPRRLHELTEGNPFFLDEVMHLLAAEGGLTQQPDTAPLPVPEGVRETVRRRLRPIRDPVTDLLVCAAVIGKEFRLELVAQASGLPAEECLDLLDEAAHAGLVRSVPAEPGRYAFGHALIREVLYEELPTRRRVELHGAVGEALERLHGRVGEDRVSQLAYHFLKAAPRGEDPRALDYAIRAGDAAMRVLAYEQAAEFYEAALGLLRSRPEESGRRGEVLLSLGAAEVRAGRLGRAREVLDEAAALARERDDPESFALAAHTSAPWGVSPGEVDEDLVRLLEEALERLPDADSALRARLLARLATALYWSDQVERRYALAEEAIDIARRVGDPATLATVLSDAHIATWDPESVERSLPWASEICALSERVGDPDLALHAQSWRIGLLLELDDISGVDQSIQAFARLATDRHHALSQCYVPLHRSMRALMEGRFADVERLVGEASVLAERFQQESIVTMLIAGQLYIMRLAQARLGELEEGVRYFADSYPAMPAWRCALGVVYRDQGRVPEMRREFDRVAANDFAGIPRDNLYLPALALITEVCAELGDAERATVLERLMEPFADRHVVSPDCAFIGPVRRYLGMLSATQGAWDRAEEHFERARDAAQRMTARPTAAQVALDEARMLLARGDGERAARRLDEARAIAEELGMDAFVERVERVRADAGEAARVAPAAVEGGEPPAARLERRGEYWAVRFGAADEFLLKETKGLRYLAHLLTQPDVEVHALELMGEQTGGGVAPSAAAEVASGELSVRAEAQGGAGPALDAQAKTAYRERLEELREEIEEATSFNDPERAARAREEFEFITDQLSAGVGLGGRDRETGSAAERARVNVTRALKTVIQRMGEHDPALGHHLDVSVRTGTWCSYRPGPGGARWELGDGV